MNPISAGALHERFAGLSARLDQATATYRGAIQEHADAERLYTVAKANAFLGAEGRTAAERNAVADKVVAEERHRAHLADGMAKAALEEIRNLREQMSSLKTIAAARRAEEFVRAPSSDGGKP